MIIRSIAVENLRAHERFLHELSPNVTLVTGKNGSGKTTLLEAVSVALGGKSFKGSDAELLRSGAEWWRIDVRADDQERTIRFQPDRPNRRKTFEVDTKTNARLLAKDHYPIVLFEPDDLQLLSGSPSRRRRFIDGLIGQIYPNYSKALHRYERALLQRNRLLKTGGSTSEVFAWNVALSEYGAQIIDMRVRFIERINSGLDAVYGTISQSGDVVSVHYSHTLIDNTQQKLLTELEANYAKDKLYGATSVGPHRHDVHFLFNGSPAASVASRGEVRTILLAIKFLEVDIIQEYTGRTPIVLLDDVFSELDSTRQTQLTTRFRDHQIVMTSASTHAELSDALVIEL